MKEPRTKVASTGIAYAGPYTRDIAPTPLCELRTLGYVLSRHLVLRRRSLVDILSVLRQAQGGEAITSLARQFHIDPATADAAVAGIVAELSRALERNTLNRGGVADLMQLLGEVGTDPHLEHGKSLGSPEIRDTGNVLLGEILWNKDRSRALAARVSRATGVDEESVKAMLPVVATMLVGGLAQESRSAIGDVMGKIPGLPRSDMPPPKQSGSTRPQEGIGSQQPLPMPSDSPRSAPRHNPYDDLSDVIRRGGSKVPQGSGSQSLDEIIRNILGGILGFESKGIIGWVIRFLVLRVGMSVLRAVLRRVLTGR
jgi:hypothetical protein